MTRIRTWPPARQREQRRAGPPGSKILEVEAEARHLAYAAMR